MFMRLYLKDSFMIRRVIATAVPAALVAVGMSLAISEPANACRRGPCNPDVVGVYLKLEGRGGGANNTNQVYPNNRGSLIYLDMNSSFQPNRHGARSGVQH
jgi:hypothetical protein